MNYEKAIRRGMVEASIKTQKELAQRTGLTPVTVHSILNGKTPKMSSLNKLAIAFNVPLLTFLGWGL